MARSIYDLTLASEEQNITLLDGYTAEIKFDACYKRWYYNLYYYGETIASGIALNPDTAPLLGYTSSNLGLVDTGSQKEEYEPYTELGGRLKLMEILE